MADVSETIVREYFELHGFFVRQQRKYIAPTRREDEEIDFFVLNPRHVAAGQPLPFVLTSEDLHGSKPYGPSGDPWTSGEVPTRFAPRASPSPSPRPSLSLREGTPRTLCAPCALEPTHGPLTPSFSPSEGERVPGGRERGEVHGQGESSAGLHNPARRLPDELPEQPDLPPAVPSPCGRVRVRESACRSTQRLGPFPKLSNLASPPAAPEVSHDNEPRRIIPPCERGPGRVCPSGQVVRRL